jgi:bacterioferritin (cytochrome b1)
MAQNPSGNFALDNLTYDLITILHEKSKGLEAYERYLRDAQQDSELRSLLEQIRQDDQRHIQQLEQHLQRSLSRGGQQNRAA